MYKIMPDQTEIFRYWLRKVIKKDKRITGKKLAKLVPCDPSTISSYVRFRTRPDYDTQVTVKRILGATDAEVTEQGLEEMAQQQQAPAQPTITTNMATIPRRRAIEFQDRARGEAAMKALAEIGRLDIRVFASLCDYITERHRHMRHQSPEPGPQVKSSAS